MRFSDGLWERLMKKLDRLTTIDSEDRFGQAVRSLQAFTLESNTEADPAELLTSIRTFTSRGPPVMFDTFQANRAWYFEHGDAKPLLGNASARMYGFVREHLQIPFITTNDLRTPPTGSVKAHKEIPTLGSLITKIYIAFRNGSLYVPAMECLDEAMSCRKVEGLPKCRVCETRND